MKKTALLALLIFFGSNIPAETINLDRQKVVELALERNEVYQSELLEKDRVRGQYIEARAGAFPRLSFDGLYLRNIDLQTSVLTMTDDEGESEKLTLKFGTPHNYSLGFTLYQPLYAAGKVGAAIKIARYGFNYTDERIRAARHDIATQADKAYLDAIAAQEAAYVYREAERLADSNLAVVHRMYEQGQVSEFDYLRAQVRASNSRPDRIASENQARLAMDNLRNLLALPPDAEIQMEATIEEIIVPDLDLSQLTLAAVENRPELRQSDEMVKIRKKVIDIEKGGYKPNLGISSTIQWDHFADKFKYTTVDGDEWNRSWNVALSLNWPIFSGLETSGKVRQAKVDYTQSQLQKNQLMRQIRLEVRDAHGRVNESRQRVEALGETVDQAVRGVEIAQVRFQSGVGTQLELLDSQVALTTARVNRISALHDLAVAVAGLRRAVGREWGAQW
jgi:outer membrane protein TolC